MIKVNSKNINPRFYKPEVHEVIEASYKQALEDNKDDAEMVKWLQDKAVYDENGYFVCMDMQLDPPLHPEELEISYLKEVTESTDDN